MGAVGYKKASSKRRRKEQSPVESKKRGGRRKELRGKSTRPTRNAGLQEEKRSGGTRSL